tara:strand:+ start:865 stop:1128 length:264 start_codon:yes stop_codon:yes gene_type:complete
MSDKEKIFADGFSFKTRPNQPDFVVGRMSIKLEDALPFLKENAKNGWVNLNINIARSGNPYVELDTFVPEKKQEEAEPVKEEEKLPF